MVVSNKIEHNKRHNSEIGHHGRCTPCLSNSITLCCKEVIGYSAFKIAQAKCEFNTHKIDCKSAVIIKLNMLGKARDLSTFAKANIGKTLKTQMP